MVKKKTPTAIAVPSGYPVTVQRYEGIVLVACPDIPELSSVADSMHLVAHEALDAIETALYGYMQDRRPIPAASACKRGQLLVYLPTLTMAKLALYAAMLEQGLNTAELARRLGLTQQSADRLLDLRRDSKVEQVDAALHCLDRRVALMVLTA